MRVETTDVFDAWMDGLDQRTQVRIAARVAKLSHGLWGDCKSVGEGVTELREHFGPGFRIYVVQVDKTLVVVLGGGDKSTQSSDIRRAITNSRSVKP